MNGPKTAASVAVAAAIALVPMLALTQDKAPPKPAEKPSSYMPVVITEDFAVTMARMKAARAGVMKRQSDLLHARYDMANRPARGITMFRGKPVQEGIRVRLPKGLSWDQLGAMRPDDIRARDLFPAGFLPLPHPNHPEGGMVFPQFHIDEIKRQEQRDLTRFDLDFDLPDHFLPEFPAPIFLTTRPDLGDVAKGQQLTIDNFHELFNGVLNPKQIEGLRLLLTPFPQRNRWGQIRHSDIWPGVRSDIRTFGLGSDPTFGHLNTASNDRMTDLTPERASG